MPEIAQRVGVTYTIPEARTPEVFVTAYTRSQYMSTYSQTGTHHLFPVRMNLASEDPSNRRILFPVPPKLCVRNVTNGIKHLTYHQSSYLESEFLPLQWRSQICHRNHERGRMYLHWNDAQDVVIEGLGSGVDSCDPPGSVRNGWIMYMSCICKLVVAEERHRVHAPDTRHDRRHSCGVDLFVFQRL